MARQHAAHRILQAQEPGYRLSAIAATLADPLDTRSDEVVVMRVRTTVHRLTQRKGCFFIGRQAQYIVDTAGKAKAVIFHVEQKSTYLLAVEQRQRQQVMMLKLRPCC